MPVLGFIELVFIGIFFILMVIGTALDRRYNESPKWWILGLGLAGAIAYFWGKTDFTSLWTVVQSWSFWSPFATYLGAGLVYSVAEFILSVRKLARKHAASWNTFIEGSEATYTTTVDGRTEVVDGNWVKTRSDGSYYIMTSKNGIRSLVGGEQELPVTKTVTNYRDVFKAAQAGTATKEKIKDAKKLLDMYLGRDEYRLSDLRKDFVQVELSAGTREVQPVINRARLSAFIGAWTFMWPAYAVSLLLGDFLVEVFRVIGDFFSKIGGRFVRLTFADTFKV